ncbi:MAG: hypothetical protein AAF791_15570 [Bacteroidota bacterium]
MIRIVLLYLVVLMTATACSPDREVKYEYKEGIYHIGLYTELGFGPDSALDIVEIEYKDTGEGSRFVAPYGLADIVVKDSIELYVCDVEWNRDSALGKKEYRGVEVYMVEGDDCGAAVERSSIVP